MHLHTPAAARNGRVDRLERPIAKQGIKSSISLGSNLIGESDASDDGVHEQLRCNDLFGRLLTPSVIILLAPGATD